MKRFGKPDTRKSWAKFELALFSHVPGPKGRNTLANGLGIRAVDPIRGLKGRNTILREADAAFFEITISKGSCRGFTVPGAESSPLPRGGHSCADSLLREYW
jgi:hypothetical protein